ncbi:MAG: OsmC family protein [bacterium]|nr:OsmC family protein [bacterium]
MGVEMQIAYEGQLRCRATHGPSGAVLVTDAPLDNGGKAASFSPTDLVATATGACIMTIMGLVAQRHNLDLTGTTIRVVKEMVAEPVRRIGALAITITLPKGLALGADDRARLERTAQACPVKHSLHPEVKVAVTFVYPA